MAVLTNNSGPRSESQAIRGASSGTLGQAGRIDSGPCENWQIMINALPDAALTLDSKGVISHQNDLIRALFPEMALGKSMGQLLRNPDLTAAIDKAFASSGAAIVVKFSERVPVARIIEATVTRLEPSLQSASLLVTFRDLTERERVDRMRADFVANASHELRTPLAALQGYIETLQGPAREDEAARERFLGIMLSQARRMTRLVDDLLSLSRVEMRAHIAPQGRADLNEIAAYVVQSLGPLAEQHGVEIVLERPDEPAIIRADRDEIVQALQNLIHNAIKYGGEKGRVEIAVAQVPANGIGVPRLAASVTDNGPGIEAHHLPRLVERFYRVSAASSREKGGTGLGLAIVKHIMARHRGELTIESEIGRGSTFALVFDELAP